MSNKKTEKDIVYKYRFAFEDKTEKKFIVRLDYQTLDLIENKHYKYPDWGLLENFKCPNCTLDSEKNTYCPVIIQIADVIEEFRNSESMEIVDVYIDSESGQFYKKTSLHDGIKALIGILMVSTGCPILSKLKPMVRIHLPFANLRERKYRVLTMYLLAQYFVEKWGGEPDWNFNDLVNIFNDVSTLNRYFCDKLNKMLVKDATINAIISLDAFAFYTSMHITKNMLNVLEDSFKPYLGTHERRHGKRKKKW